MRTLTAMVVVTAALAIAALACGSDGEDDAARSTPAAAEPSATRAAGTRPGETPAPAATASRGATPTPEATATSTQVPEPTPAELIFTEPDASDGSASPRSTGPLGVVYASAQVGADNGANRLEATATVNIGINERPTATAWMWNLFRAPGEGSAVTAQVSSDVDWKGVLAGNGAAGTGVAVTIRLAVLEGNRTIASTVVHTLERRESALSVGGADDIGSDSADLQAVLVPGRLYELRLSVTCEAFSGLLGVVTHCIFGPSDVYEDGYVHWGERRILFAP